jgi:hypothetical protein
MNPEGNDPDFGSSVTSTIKESLATTSCDNDSNGRQHAVRDDSTLSGKRAWA